MVAVLTFLKENPQAWGPLGTVLAALAAIAGVVFSLRGQATASRRQREFELRRTELFKLVADAALGIRVINEVVVMDKTTAELSRIRAPMMESHTRAMCFADPKTIRETYKTEVVFVREWTPLVRLLAFHNKVRSSIDMIIKATDSANEPFDQNELAARIKRLELFRQKIHLQLAERALIAGRNYSKAWTELELAVRAELDRANMGKQADHVRPENYREMVEESVYDVEKLTRASLEWQKRFLTMCNDVSEEALVRFAKEEFEIA